MIEFSLTQYYTIFVFLSILLEVSYSYNKLSTDDPKLCSPISKRKLKLGLDSMSGLIITIGRSSYHSLDWDKNFLCKFQVEAGQSNNGLFAVIQNIVFRKNESTDECIDYVQFKRRDGSSSKKFCGRLNAALGMDPIFAPDVYVTNLAPTINSIVDPLGQLDVYIYIARESLRMEEETSLEIVFTSFRRSCLLRNDHPCGEQYGDRCIFQGFFNDGYVNCPYPGCVDEDGCSEKVHDERKNSIGNKVIIGSVTLLLLLFVVFICFVWLCRRYKKLCWAEEFANPSSNADQNARTFEMNEPSTIETPMPSSGSTVASGLGASSTEEDKDLPPSYDSLFPNR